VVVQPKNPQEIAREDSMMTPEADLICSLAGTNASSELRLAYKTRRLVYCTISNISQRKIRSKRSLALAMAAVLAILVVLSPVIWNAVDHLIGEEHFGDIQTQMSLLLLFVVPALLAALLLLGKSVQAEGRGGRLL
jgi:uncharacterized membrane protein